MQTLFHLGNYENATELGELFIWKIPVAPSDFTRGLLMNDKCVIEETLKGIIKYIRGNKYQPFHWSNNIQDAGGRFVLYAKRNVPLSHSAISSPYQQYLFDSGLLRS